MTDQIAAANAAFEDAINSWAFSDADMEDAANHIVATAPGLSWAWSDFGGIEFTAQMTAPEFVVVAEWATYCPFTDGHNGSARRRVTAGPRALCDLTARRMAWMAEGEEEVSYFVARRDDIYLRRLAAPYLAAVARDDGMPF